VVVFNTKITGFVDRSELKKSSTEAIQSQAKILKQLKQKMTTEQFENARDVWRYNMLQNSMLQGYGPPVVVGAGKLFLIFCNISSPLAGGPLASTSNPSLSSETKPILYLFECDISNCQDNGFEAREGGSVVCIKSKIHHNVKGPLIWYKAIRADMIGCEIFENEHEGILIQTGDETYQNDIDVRMINNTVHGNGYIGISTGSLKSLLLKGNEIYENKGTGVYIQRPRQVNEFYICFDQSYSAKQY
jgi:hypothetical protein